MSTVTPLASARSTVRAVAMPTEHGGWGLTLEPVLLGLLVAPSAAGVAIGCSAFLAFLARTPVKVVLVDRHRDRWLPRTRTAALVAGIELALLASFVVIAVVAAGFEWTLPLAVAAPLFGIELAFDARSRSRRLVPELCGAVGVAGFVAAIALAGGEPASVAIALWLLLSARAIASVTFARGQVLRLRRSESATTVGDLAQVAGVALAVAASFVDVDAIAGTACVLAVVAVQVVWSRGPARSAKVVGIWQMVFGLFVVAGAAIGMMLA